MSREGQSYGGSDQKRKEGADASMSDNAIDIYDEACSEIRFALHAYAVAVVDLSQFTYFTPHFKIPLRGITSSWTDQPWVS
jgi:hypothetical protein